MTERRKDNQEFINEVKDILVKAVNSTDKSAFLHEIKNELVEIKTNVGNLADHVARQNGRIGKIEEKLIKTDKENAVEAAVTGNDMGLIKKIVYSLVGIIVGAVIMSLVRNIIK